VDIKDHSSYSAILVQPPPICVCYHRSPTLGARLFRYTNARTNYRGAGRLPPRTAVGSWSLTRRRGSPRGHESRTNLSANSGEGSTSGAESRRETFRRSSFQDGSPSRVDQDRLSLPRREVRRGEVAGAKRKTARKRRAFFVSASRYGHAGIAPHGIDSSSSLDDAVFEFGT